MAMNCCGKKRLESQPIRPDKREMLAERSASFPLRTRQNNPPRIFRYIGEGGLVIKGAVTNRVYRFSSPGDQVEIDSRDAGVLMAHPMLNKV